MKSRKWLAVLLTLVLALSFGLTGCGSKTTKIDTDQYLNLSMVRPRTFDWQKATDTSSSQIISMTMDGLTRISNTGNGDIVEPGIAEKWETSPDGLTWTFHLRDAKWSDGQPITAQHFVDGWMRLLNPDNAFDYASFLFDVAGAEEYNAGTAKPEDVKIVAKDDKTLEVTLKAPVPYFIQITPFKNLNPTRLDVVNAAGDTYGTDPMKMVFDGPFIIKEFIKDSKIVFEKNPNYWDADKVKLQKINMQYIEEEASRYQMFEAKQIDLSGARGDYATKYKKMVDAKQLDATFGYSPSTYYIVYNCQSGGPNKIFTNAKVRTAFGLAIDRDDWVANIYKRGYVAYGLVPPTLMIGDKEFRKEAEEPLKAVMDKKQDPKELLKEGLQELGLSPDMQIEVSYLDYGTDATSKMWQEWFKQQWETNLGVKIKMNIVVDFPQYLEVSDRMEFDLCTGGWAGDFNDPETFFNLFTKGNSNNPGKWSNDEYDKLYQKTKGTNDNNERLELFKQMEKILIQDEAAISPYTYADVRAFRQTYVKNVQYTMFGDINYKYAYTEGRQ